jgi:hypothetical protein
MNDCNRQQPISPEWLAAYADGELDGPARRRIEAWLAERPEALAEAQDQEALGRANDDYWKAVAPPLPSKAAWDGVLANIADATLPERSGGRLRVASAMLAASGMAAAIWLVVVAVDRLQPVGPGPALVRDATEVTTANAHDADDEERVYQVANADDVELIQLPEAAAPLVVVGRHPMAGVPLLLASGGDMQVLNYSDSQGNFPDWEALSGPDASMLWAPTKP